MMLKNKGKTYFFLCFCVDPQFIHSIVSQALYTSLTQGEPYLERKQKGTEILLGKTIDTPSLQELSLMEKHILSLLKKIAPRYPLSRQCIKLVPLQYETLSSCSST